MRSLLPILVGVCLSTGASTVENGGDPRPVVFRTRTMGTWASLTLVTADSARVADLAYRSLLELHRVDSLMSNWTTTSEVARINATASSATVTVHPEVATVLAAAGRVADESDGAFDITIEPLVRAWGFLGGTPRVPSSQEIATALACVGRDRLTFDPDRATVRFAREGVRIDFGGIAKGYGVDRVAALLREVGVTDALVDLSGNMAAIGNAAGHRGWAVGVRDPSGTLPWLVRVTLANDAVSTSGDYEQFVDANGERHGHILDPRTGRSARGLSSVTVVASSAMQADAWSTALFVLGPEAARALATARDDLSVILVEPRTGAPSIVWIERSLRERVVVSPDLRAHEIRPF